MSEQQRDADLADLVIVICGDPRHAHPESAIALKRCLHAMLARRGHRTPQSPEDLRYDVVAGISPVHLVADELRGKLRGRTHQRALWRHLIDHAGVGFIGMHQADAATPQKVAFVSHLSCGAINQPDLSKERRIINQDHQLVEQWFRKLWKRRRRDQTLPDILHIVEVMAGDAGSVDARVVQALPLDGP
ncbi:MAG: hypothetical protein GXP62_02215 [Oligoflexia bacterium]|nr:hypothetical protein [Oligoflexia bacterium]